MFEHVPEPTIIMFGCRPFDNATPRPADCPVCKGGVRPGHDARYCGKCDSMSPRVEAKIEQSGLPARVDGKLQRYRAGLAASVGSVLTESERRRYWNGCKDPADGDDEITNRAKEGREWLVAIGQEPDWTLVRDERGRWVRPGGDQRPP